MMLQRLIGIILFGLLVDLVIYLGLIRIGNRSGKRLSTRFLQRFHLYLILLLILSVIIFYAIQGQPRDNFVIFRSYMLLFNLFALQYFPKLILAICILIGEFILFIRKLLFNRRSQNSNEALSQKRRIPLHLRIGAGLASMMLLLFIHGMIWGISNFKVRTIDLAFQKLPRSFEGLRVAQVSDIHLGSWWNKADVEKGLQLLQDQHPDIILFTGDLINVNSDEALPYLDALKSLHAPYGKYAILGNHDVGDFTRFGTEDYTDRNIRGLEKLYKDCGFNLLRNRHAFIKAGSDSIALLGIDNWSLKRFRKLGRLDLALKGADSVAFKILLTHDPSHWREQVRGKTNIQLSLSGHTHGMQMGFQAGRFSWSPFSLIAHEWKGLYGTGEQLLYVNAGFGYVGFAARMGIWPEISLFTLHHRE